MIKTIHFIQLSLLILLLFILFQITSISISFDELKSSFQNEDKAVVAEVSSDDSSDDNTSEGNIIMITGDNQVESSNIELELRYLHKEYRVEKSLFTLSDEDLLNTDVMILASDTMQDTYNLEMVQNYMKKGIHVIMAVLPEESELDEEWQSLLGIKTMGNMSEQEGISIFSGFLLGGKQDYEKLTVETRSIKVQATCKTYIAGLSSDKESVKNEELPDLLWRNVYEGSQIYVVNGSFLESHNGIGIISAIMAQMYDDFIYPVINAKAFIVNNAPSLSYENDDEMQKRYARNSQRFFVDIVLPDITALSISSGNVPTFYGVSSLDESSTTENQRSTSVLSTVESELKRIGGELGISDYDRENLENENKVIDTINLYKEQLPDYQFKSLYVNHYDESMIDSMLSKVYKLTEINSLVSSWDKGISFSYYNNAIVNIPMITEGFTYSDEDLFKLHSMATALGVVTHGIDIDEMVYPDSEDMDWSHSFKDITAAVSTYWDKYKSLDSLNISSTQSRITRFLDITPHITRSKDSITIDIDGFDEEAYFMLRTNKEVVGIDHGKVTEIEDGAYLIYANHANVNITLEETSSDESRR